jgi:hypothetical protein
MDKISLDIEDYSMEEMMDILSLKKNSGKENIIIQKNNLQTKILNDNSITNSSRQDISKFVDKIATILKNHWKEEKDASKTPTSFSELTQNVSDIGGEHFIIENPNNIGRYDQSPGSGIVSESGAPPGIINPINYKTIKKSINIDSRFRPNYFETSASDLNLNLPERIDNITKMTLVSLELPLSFYTVSRNIGNNNFTIEYKLYGDEEVYYLPVLLADGNYQVLFVDDTSAKSIEAGINEGLRAAIMGNKKQKEAAGIPINEPLHPALVNLRYSVDTATCKSIFAFQPDATAKDTANFNDDDDESLKGKVKTWGILFNVGEDGDVSAEAPIMLRLGWLLGFRTGAYTTSNYGAFVSEGICYPKGPNYIYISIDDYNNNTNNYFTALYNSSINNNNIFARINLANIIASNGIYSVGGDDSSSTSLSRSREYFGPVNIQKLRITLYDEYGRILLLNNMDWSISLMFECIYS